MLSEAKHRKVEQYCDSSALPQNDQKRKNFLFVTYLFIDTFLRQKEGHFQRPSFCCKLFY